MNQTWILKYYELVRLYYSNSIYSIFLGIGFFFRENKNAMIFIMIIIIPPLFRSGVVSIYEYGFLPLLIGGFFLYVSYYGCDQTQAQRLLSAKNEKNEFV